MDSLNQLLLAESNLFFNTSNEPPEEWIHTRLQDSIDDKSAMEIAEPLLMVIPLFIIDEKFGLLFVMESEKGYEYREKES